MHALTCSFKLLASLSGTFHKTLPGFVTPLKGHSLYTHSEHRFPAPSSKLCQNRRFPEITGEDNLTVFSYSGRVRSPEWRRQRRRADLRQFEIFSHGPVIIYTRLPAGGTYYRICMFPTNSGCLIGISDAFYAFCLRVSVIFLTCSRYHQQKRAYSALHPDEVLLYVHINRKAY